MDISVADPLAVGRDSLVRVQRVARPVEYGDLSNDIQRTLAKLEGRVIELEYDARLYKLGIFLAFVLLAERLWVWAF